MGQDLCFEKIVEASTPKFGEWAERWISREPRNRKAIGIVVLRSSSSKGFVRIPAFSPLSKFGGGLDVVKGELVSFD